MLNIRFQQFFYQFITLYLHNQASGTLVAGNIGRIPRHDNPVNQIVGYIMSGDPTYITSHKNARSLIMKVERDEILEVLFENYIDTQLK